MGVGITRACILQEEEEEFAVLQGVMCDVVRCVFGVSSRASDGGKKVDDQL